MLPRNGSSCTRGADTVNHMLDCAVAKYPTGIRFAGQTYTHLPRAVQLGRVPHIYGSSNERTWGPRRHFSRELDRRYTLARRLLL
ncbi:MAG: hypothetical protein JWO42_1010 [Chloroflexi bacterium]|jgi:hypothetical protein|nr:hypothetical protein [Chloroflexota bacterium]